MASVVTDAKSEGNSSSRSSPFFTLWFTKGNYTSALLHECTANFRSYWDEIIHGWENLGSHESVFIINPTPKPNWDQKHPFNHARTHTPPFSLLDFILPGNSLQATSRPLLSRRCGAQSSCAKSLRHHSWDWTLPTINSLFHSPCAWCLWGTRVIAQ